MNFLIADTFTASFNRLSGLDQKAVKASVFDLQINPTGAGLQLHRIDKSKDANFWSARVNRDVRLIVHKTAGSMLVAYVDHHDDAYEWAQRRRRTSCSRSASKHPSTHRDAGASGRAREDPVASLDSGSSGRGCPPHSAGTRCGFVRKGPHWPQKLATDGPRHLAARSQGEFHDEIS